MNISKKSCKNYMLTMLKLFPLIYMVAGVLHGHLDLSTMNSYWSDFGLTSNIVGFFDSVGITMGVLGSAMIGYFNYIVMFHLLECLVEVVLFIPELFLALCEKIKGVDY